MTLRYQKTEVLAALTDFSTRRPGPMAHLDPSLYQVHGSGAD